MLVLSLSHIINTIMGIITMIKSAIKWCLDKIKRIAHCHKSNELHGIVEIESQSQSAPPSPNRPQSSKAASLSMYPNLDLKYQHWKKLKHYPVYPGGVCVVWPIL